MAILDEYINKALEKAVYEVLEDGTYAAEIPECQGVIALGKSLDECKEELKSVLEDWIILGLKLAHPIPIIDGIDLNKELRVFPLETL